MKDFGIPFWIYAFRSNSRKPFSFLSKTDWSSGYLLKFEHLCDCTFLNLRCHWSSAFKFKVIDTNPLPYTYLYFRIFTTYTDKTSLIHILPSKPYSSLPIWRSSLSFNHWSGWHDLLSGPSHQDLNPQQLLRSLFLGVCYLIRKCTLPTKRQKMRHEITSVFLWPIPMSSK